MKTTIVPAQITTVEDKIAGNLSFTQLLLLTAPVFLGGAVFVLAPPLFRYTLLKAIFAGSVGLICSVLAIRIRGRIVLQWIATVVRYRIRPQFYLFNKNDTYLRSTANSLVDVPEYDQHTEVVNEYVTHQGIPTSEKARLESAIGDPRAKFHISAKKGVLRVYIHEIKEEGI